MTRQANRKKWDAIIRDLESSGLSANRYATQHQISKSSLYNELRSAERAQHRALIHPQSMSLSSATSRSTNPPKLSR